MNSRDVLGSGLNQRSQHSEDALGLCHHSSRSNGSNIAYTQTCSISRADSSKASRQWKDMRNHTVLLAYAVLVFFFQVRSSWIAKVQSSEQWGVTTHRVFNVTHHIISSALGAIGSCQCSGKESELMYSHNEFNGIMKCCCNWRY